MDIISLRQLKYFVGVANTGSFTATAERLNVSQPAIGIQIKQLEERLGLPLFERHSRGVELTHAGEVYLSYAETALNTLEAAEHALNEFREDQPARVRIGVTPTIERTLLPLLFFESQSPDVALRIQLSAGLSDKLFDEIQRGELDCAFCYDPPTDQGVILKPLYREDLYLVGPAAVVGQDTCPIEFSELANKRLVLSPHPNRLRTKIEGVAHDAGITITPEMEFSLAGLKHELLLHHQHCALSPYGLFLKDIQSGELVARHIVNPTVGRRMHFVISRKLPATVAHRLQQVVVKLIHKVLDEGTMNWTQIE
ncbi:LysR family transcriptional regulator [Alkalilacustris brevis]|uniref:LysR family transcriptional regulator n=1 Tax=Alkalilacustris brevis TaxID=2026338 RepID=UPI000E0CD0A8|nr:LysR family transcriptional regulator [Alkalilacustris brevis]